MSMLDDLKKAAEISKKQDQDGEQRRELQIEEFRKDSRPKLKEAFRYFKELVETLNVLDQEVRRDILIEGKGQFRGLVQTGYLITASSDDSYSEVTIAFRCKGRAQLKLELNTPLSVSQLKDFLFNQDIKFRLIEKRDARGDLKLGRFEISPDIPCAIRFKTNPESQQIDLTLKNLGRIGNRHIKLKLHYLKESFYDELVKFIMTKPSKFDIKEKLDMDDDTRRRLKQKLAEQKQSQQAEEKKSHGLFGSLFKK